MDAGVVDQDYRGGLGIVLCNNGTEDFEVKVGDRIAQLLLERVSTPEVVVVEELDESDRGNLGFGSTGVQDIKPHTSMTSQPPIVD